MQVITWFKHAWRSACIGAALAGAATAADPVNPAPPTRAPDTTLTAVATDTAVTTDTDPRDWKCAQCPFFQGYDTQSEVGVLHASGANASFGRYSGIDHSGTYADVSGSGQLRRGDGAYLDYDLERLGLASRDGHVEGGREGRYDLRVSYDGQPTRLYDTASTPFQAGGNQLALPAGWVAAGSTSGMSALNASLAPARLESDRRTVALLGRYFASPHWTLFGEFRHQEHNGTGRTSAAFLTDAVQLPQPFDYVTDSIEGGAQWAGSMAGLRLTYTGSWFSDGNDSILFANPYLPIVPGSVQGQLGTPPGNNLQLLAASGNVQLPWTTTLTYAASLGTLKQDDAYLPLSTLAGSPSPASGSLDGTVHLSHYALGLASRPLSNLSVRGNAAYDGRDDKTRPQAIAYIVTDTFPGGTAGSRRYSEDRARLDGGADYTLMRGFKIGVGGKLDEVHYGPGQVVTWTQNVESWGRAIITPMAALNFTLKIGNALRKASSFNAAALPTAENPQIRAYNYAPRDRVFSTLTGTWTATSTLTWSLEGSLAKNDYRSSPLGLLGTHEQRASTTLAWNPRATLSAYAEAGYQRLFNLQNGYSGSGALPWFASVTERFWNLGLGGRWVPQERWTLSLDYLLAPTHDNTDTSSGAQQQAFPENWSKLESMRFDTGYQWTTATQIHLSYAHERYNSSDWALDGVGSATVPTLLSLGIAPYRDSVNVFGLSVRHRFGRNEPPARRSK